MILFKNLPDKVNGFVVCTAESDGDYYTVVLSNNLSVEKSEETYLHELTHIERNDMFSTRSVSDCEFHM